jgi:DNA-binding response OmpR family regulator
VLLDDHRDATRAIQAIRLQVTDYLLLDAPIDELRMRIHRLGQHVFDSQLGAPMIEEPPDSLESETNGNTGANGAITHITWDESLNAVRRGDTWISLSPIEWRLFHTLVNRRGAVVPLEDLVLKGLQRASNSNADVPLLRLHISRLRSKLNDNFGHELNVVTLRGRGYMLV